ncbi:MAG: GMP synthase (glutamine-hydrolyzing), partial [SAR202 cluster bacterium]|nr:GMP synthase (glutamine-hydrolyzing) [SAR202 cluster bacterium]
MAEEKLGQSTDPSEAPRGADEAVVVLDFGSQFSRLIARRLRESHVYCEIFPPNVAEEQLAHLNVKGFILSGGPASVFDDDAPQLPAFVLSSGVP